MTYATDVTIDPVEQLCLALESGYFRQGHRALQILDDYCCLGVACVVAALNGVDVLRDRSGRVLGVDLDRQEAVREWYGIDSMNGTYWRPSGELRSLAYDNDDGHTFAQIAGTIRSRHAGMFVER